MKKVILSLLIAGVLTLCCACAGNAPATDSALIDPVSESVPETVSSSQPAPGSDTDEADIVQPYPAATPEDAVNYFKEMPPRAFGMAEPYNDYKVRYIDETPVEGGDCYRMELEVAYPGDTRVLTLFIRTDLGIIYHFDDESGSYHEVIPYEYYCPQESSADDYSGPMGYPEGGDDAATDYLRRYSKEELNLPAELSEYVVRVDGEMDINGERFKAVGVYADLGTRMELMGTYYVAFDNSSAYATDLKTGGYKELPVK